VTPDLEVAVNSETKLEIVEREDALQPSGMDKAYLEFELGPQMLPEVQKLACAAGCSPFQMCVTLLEEGVNRASGASSAV